MNTTQTNCACPVCEASIPVPGDAVVGEVLVCEDCAAELEVTALSPLTLNEAPETAEDWGE